MNKKIVYFIIILTMVAFILFPYPASKLYIRIDFDKNNPADSELYGDSFTLYYSTDTINVFSPEQYIRTKADQEKYQVEFCLDASLENHITGLRLDFPNIEQLLCIKNITVSSAGIIKRQYNPCDFFASDNIKYSNNINAMDLAIASARTYISTMENESYVILSDNLCQQITECYSHFRLTRLMICIFILSCYYFSKKKIFKEDIL